MIEAKLAPIDEAIQLLRRVLHTTQALEGEVRELKQQMLWQAPPTLKAEDDKASKPRLVAAPEPKEEVAKPRQGAHHAVYTPKGPVSAARMKAVRARLDLTQQRTADALDVSTAMVGFIESGRCGISNRVHQGLLNLENKPKVRS